MNKYEVLIQEAQGLTTKIEVKANSFAWEHPHALEFFQDGKVKPIAAFNGNMVIKVVILEVAEPE